MTRTLSPRTPFSSRFGMDACTVRKTVFTRSYVADARCVCCAQDRFHLKLCCRRPSFLLDFRLCLCYVLFCFVLCFLEYALCLFHLFVVFTFLQQVLPFFSSPVRLSYEHDWIPRGGLSMQSLLNQLINQLSGKTQFFVVG